MSGGESDPRYRAVGCRKLQVLSRLRVEDAFYAAHLDVRQPTGDILGVYRKLADEFAGSDDSR